jgi:hypothetical protein
MAKMVLVKSWINVQCITTFDVVRSPRLRFPLKKRRLRR